MGLSPWAERQAEQVQLTLQAWQDGGRLVVLDNILKKTVLEAWLPRLGNVSVLVTSPLKDVLAGPSVTIPVGGLERSDSLALLRSLAPELSSEEDAQLEQLAERLGDLPLALDLAGRYLHSRTRLSLKGYLQELEKGGSALEHNSMRGASSFSPMEHNTSLIDTFSAQWQMLSGQSEVETLARRLFITCSYLAPDTYIPMALMETSLMPDLESYTADYSIRPALNLLTGLSLMDAWEETEEAAAGQSIHPLLADFGRRLDDDREGLKRLVRGLVTMANAAGESGIPDHYEALLPHLQVVAMHADQAAGLEEETGMLWNALGTHSEMAGVYEQAVNYYRRGLAVYERRDRQGHPTIAVLANNLGSVLHAIGELEEALSTLERALEVCRRVYQSGQPLEASIRSNLGAVLLDMGNLREAQTKFEQALTIDEKVFGQTHPNYARDLNHLGNALKDLGDLRRAESLFEQALAIDQKVFGQSHPNVARDLNNLGEVQYVLGELDGARAAFERALAIDEQVFGQEHPNIAPALNNLGQVLRDLGDLEAARMMLERALSIDIQAFGVLHPRVGRDRANLGRVLHGMGKLQEATANFKGALETDERIYGNQHPLVAEDLTDLGWVLFNSGELSQAREAFERALKIDRSVFGSSYPRVAQDVNNLGRVQEVMGDLPAAINAYQAALGMLEKLFPDGHPDQEPVRQNLRRVQSSMDQRQA